MTLRLLFGLIVVALLAISVTSRADFAPGVWDQLQAKITNVEIMPEKVLVSFRYVGMDTPGSRTETLCRPKDSTDVIAAAEYSQQLQQLREAKKSGEIVELSVTGPWSPCLRVSL